ncbi:unnamed protein product (macronuclear) [Paramecium tetraurelia]|uniref:CDT1 Geminin-binding domain-containing protein n=1 Tax=Paramecium tetraurelia TaxID=5888 RepID=A0DT08_PARTE|nr:uncharacterized protein GSPATT00019868001 [Paramecium tetraurelia]CAK86175.1 unnamed protein product [Paramecium tetraurelia]|eukprot:XP_001453572.1 hypothetical protein (macronuclear) [Paramecium tetraurelia strain d4-2]
MLKYIQDQDFGTFETLQVQRQKKVFCMNMPMQQLIKSRSVSQILHGELITLQKSSARKKQKEESYLDRISSPIKPIEMSQSNQVLPKINLQKTQTEQLNKTKKRIKVLNNISKRQHDFDQWNQAFYQNRSINGQSPRIQEIKKALQEQMNDGKSQSLNSSILLKLSRTESPKKRPNTEKALRNLLCEYVLDDKIAFNDLILDNNRQVQDPKYMIEQVVMNYEILKQIFRIEKTITKIILKTQGLSKKIIHTFFKEIKPNCPNDISQFEYHFKLRRNISKSFIISKFIIGVEPELDQTIEKLLNREALSPDMQSILLSPEELLQKALESLKFDYDYLNKLNYFNINLQDQIKQKQVKAIQNKLILNGSIIDQTNLSLDFEQPQSLLAKINDCERRLGKFQKISNQSRFKCLEAEAYLYYR